MPGPDGIYYLRFDLQQTGWLTRFDPDDGAHHDLLRVEGEGGVQELFGNGGLWISRDGGRALLSSIDRSHSDLWIGSRGQQ